MAVIVAVLGVLLGIFLAFKNREFSYIMVSAISLFVAFIVGVVIDGPINWAMRDKVDVTYGLAALNDGRKTQGSFFLGSGTIDSVPSFMYYAEDGDGYVLRDWSARSSRVVETTGKPRAVFTCDDYGSVPRPFRYSVKMILDDGWGWVDCRHAFVTFYVPPGSVKQEITLDAQ